MRKIPAGNIHRLKNCLRTLALSCPSSRTTVNGCEIASMMISRAVEKAKWEMISKIINLMTLSSLRFVDGDENFIQSRLKIELQLACVREIASIIAQGIPI